MIDAELVTRVASTTGMSSSEATRVITDVLAWYREPLDQLVRRRHALHQLHGKRNCEIFALIADELQGRLIAPPRLSERQLRRIVYS